MTAQDSDGKGDKQSTTWVATVIVQARREGEKNPGGKEWMSKNGQNLKSKWEEGGASKITET